MKPPTKKLHKKDWTWTDVKSVWQQLASSQPITNLGLSLFFLFTLKMFTELLFIFWQPIFVYLLLPLQLLLYFCRFKTVKLVTLSIFPKSSGPMTVNAHSSAVTLPYRNM